MSEDEFDQLPDPFSGIDWNTVPGLSTIPPVSQPGAPTSGGGPALVEPRLSTPSANGRDASSPSTQYSFDEWEPPFLDELNKLEQTILQPQVAGGLFSKENGGEGTSSRSNASGALASRYFHGTALQVVQDISSTCSASRYPSTKGSHEEAKRANFHAEDSRDDFLPISGPTKVVHQMSSPPTRGSSPKRHKGKQKDSPMGILKEFLNNFQDEMICPICCDIFALAHLGNPCGHTFCGECGWRWIKKNREAPSCAICRASLSVDAPMIPNFAVDNAVEKHVAALRAGGIEGWEHAGAKFKEWQARKERWKADSKMKARKKTPTFSVIVGPYVARGSSPGGSAYIGGDAGRSRDESGHPRSFEGEREAEAVAVRREPIHRRPGRNNHYHDNQYRRSGGNRRDRVPSGRNDGRGESGSRARRSRRRRRD